MSNDASITVYWDDACLEHDPGAGAFSLPSTDMLAVDEPHPDRPERMLNIKRIIERTLPNDAHFAPVEPVTRGQIERVHDPAYLDDLRRRCEEAPSRLTETTRVSSGSYEAIRHAAGAAILAAESAVRSDALDVHYALSRPSGHHAQTDRADGFCFVNNVAVAVEHVIDTGLVDSVAIVDWDVHHGNGTQEIFYDRNDVLFISLHDDHGSWDPESHPQTGRTDERGHGRGVGYNVNLPLPLGTGDEGYAHAFDRIVEPVISQFGPDLILVSAGQDAGFRDPLARNTVTKAGFERLGARIRRLAEGHATGNFALVQEGGYQITDLAFATLGVLEGASGVDASLDGTIDWNERLSSMRENYDLAAEWIQQAADAYTPYWDLDG